MLSKKSLLILTIVLLIIPVIASIFLYGTYQRNQRYLDLLSDVSPGGLTVDSDPPSEDVGGENLLPDYPELPEDLYLTEIPAVSMGNFSSITVKSDFTGKNLGTATVLEVIAEDWEGKAKTLIVVLQIFLSSDPNVDLIAWLATDALITKNPSTLPQGDETFSLDQLSSIFTEGSVWLFSPLINPNIHEGRFAKENQDYTFFMNQYYGDKISDVKDSVGSDFEKNSFDLPLLLVGAEWVK